MREIALICFSCNKTFYKLPYYSTILLIVLICNGAYAQIEYVLDDDCVNIEDGYIVDCDCSSDEYIKLVIPETLDGHTVKGIGDSQPGDFPIFNSLPYIVDIEFPNTMEYIGDNAAIIFQYQIATIDFPDSLKYIGDNAFAYSSGFDSLIFPDKLEYIGKEAFKWCYIKKVRIPNSVTHIGFAAFNGNKISQINGETSNGIIYARNTDGTINYQQIVSYGGNNKHVDFIPDSVKYILNNSFDACYIESVILPDSLKSIGAYAFRGNSLSSITIPASVEYIGDFSFAHNNLETVSIPDTLYHVGVAAFNNNKIQEINNQQNNGLFYARNALGLETNDTVISYGGISDTIDFIPGTVTHINKFSFDYQKINSIKLPAGLEFIGDYSLRGNYLDTISIPESVSYIGKQALYNNDLNSIILPESVTCIEDLALSRNNLDTIILPESLTYIGIHAFLNNYFNKFILPVSETHEVLYWIDNDSIKYNGGDTISNLYGSYSAVLGDSLIHTCDSVINHSLDHTAYGSYTSPSGKYIWVSSGTYTDTIPSFMGCDSVITIHLTILNNPITIQNQQVEHILDCKGTGSITIEAMGGTGMLLYSIDNGSNYYENNGIFTDLSARTYNVKVKDNLDSVAIGSQLVIKDLSVKPFIGEIYEVYMNNNRHRYYSCIATESSVYYWSVENGTIVNDTSYRTIEVQWGTQCPRILSVYVTDESDCISDTSYFEADITPINAVSIFSGITIYPVPVDDYLHVSISEVTDNTRVNVSILNFSGNLLYTEVLSGGELDVDISALVKGNYILQLDFKGKSEIRIIQVR